MIDEDSISDCKNEISFHLFDKNMIADNKVHEAFEILQKNFLNLIDFVEKTYFMQLKYYELFNKIANEDFNIQNDIIDLLNSMQKHKINECEALILLDSHINEKLENQDNKIAHEKNLEILNKEISTLNGKMEENKYKVLEIYDNCNENDFNNLKFHLTTRKKEEEINLIIQLGSILNYSLEFNPNLLKIMFSNYQEVKSKMKMINLSEFTIENVKKMKNAFNNNFKSNLIINPLDNSNDIEEFKYLSNYAKWCKLQFEIVNDYLEIEAKNFLYNKIIHECNQIKKLELFFLNFKFFNSFNSDICSENEQIKMILQEMKKLMNELSDFVHLKLQLECPSSKLYFLELNTILLYDNKCISKLYSKMNSQSESIYTTIHIGKLRSNQIDFEYVPKFCGIINCLGAKE